MLERVVELCKLNVRAASPVEAVADDIVRELGILRQARTVHIRCDDVLLEVALVLTFRAVTIAAEHLSERSFHFLSLTAVILEADDVYGRARERGAYHDIADTALFPACGSDSEVVEEITKRVMAALK